MNKPQFQFRVGSTLSNLVFPTQFQACDAARVASLRGSTPVRVFDAPWPGGNLIQTFTKGKPNLDLTPAKVKESLASAAALAALDGRIRPPALAHLQPKSNSIPKSAPRPVWAQRKPGLESK